MKVLQVVSTMNPKSGGVAESVRQISLEMVRLGNAVEFLSTDDPIEDYLASFPLPIEATGPSHANYGFNRRFPEILRTKHDGFDAIIVHGIWQYHSWASWRVLSATATPYFVFTHGMLDPWFKREYRLKHLKKWLYWPWADYRVLRDAHAVLFTCEEERLLAHQSFWLYKAREAVTNFGTSPPPPGNPQPFLSAHPQLRERRLVLYMGRIHPKKGCDILLDAVARVSEEHPFLHLVIAGPDQVGWGKELGVRARALGIGDRVTWTGMLEGEAKWSAYRAAEALILPSHQENFGVVVAEALACGKPVLISNKVNIWREIATDGVGFVDEDTVAGTASNLKKWLELSPEDYATMSRKAMTSFDSRFHIQHAAERLIEIITQGSDLSS